MITAVSFYGTWLLRDTIIRMADLEKHPDSQYILAEVFGGSPFIADDVVGELRGFELPSSLQRLGIETIDPITLRRGTAVYQLDTAAGRFALKVAVRSRPPGGRYDSTMVLRHEAMMLQSLDCLSEKLVVDRRTQNDVEWILLHWIDGRPADEIFAEWRRSSAPGDYRRLATTSICHLFESVAALHREDNVRTM